MWSPNSAVAGLCGSRVILTCGCLGLFLVAACAAPAQEPGTRPHIRLEPPYLDYGIIDEGQERVLGLKIVNKGDDDLSIANVSVYTQDFVILTPADEWFMIIPPELDLEIEVLFRPVQRGLRTDHLRIRSDDPEAPLLEPGLFGVGRQVELDSGL